MARDLMFRAFPLEVRSTNKERGEIVGHASVYGVVDSFETVFDEGAFDKSLREQGGRVPMTHMHQPTVGVGMAQAESDGDGLLINPGRLNIKRSAAALEVFAGLPHPGEPATGYYSEMSHGFKPFRTRRDAKGLLHYTETGLREVAIVTKNFASNREAQIVYVRAAETVRDVEQAIREGHLDRIQDRLADLQDLVRTFKGEGPVEFHDLPLADRERAWNPAEAHRRLVEWSGAPDDFHVRMRRAFLWTDPDNRGAFDGLKMPFADVIRGELHAVPEAIFQTAQALHGTIAYGPNFTEQDAQAVRAHLEKYYAKMRKEWGDPTVTAPWEQRQEALSMAGILEATGSIRSTLDGLRIEVEHPKTRAPGSPHPLFSDLQALSEEIRSARDWAQ